MDSILILVVQPTTTDEEILSYLLEGNPLIVGKLPKLHQVQVQIKTHSKQELEALANQLMEKEAV